VHFQDVLGSFCHGCFLRVMAECTQTWGNPTFCPRPDRFHQTFLWTTFESIFIFNPRWPHCTPESLDCCPSRKSDFHPCSKSIPFGSRVKFTSEIKYTVKTISRAPALNQLSDGCRVSISLRVCSFQTAQFDGFRRILGDFGFA
jgi:hypothetical protein